MHCVYLLSLLKANYSYIVWSCRVQNPKMDCFAKIFTGFQPLTFSTKHCTLDIWQGSKNAYDDNICDAYSFGILSILEFDTVIVITKSITWVFNNYLAYDQNLEQCWLHKQLPSNILIVLFTRCSSFKLINSFLCISNEIARKLFLDVICIAS